MEEIQRTIEMWHIVYLTCLGLALICFVITVILFFKFKMKDVFNHVTGRGEKKTIAKMEEENALTGRLRNKAKKHYSVKNNDQLEPIYTPSGSLTKTGNTVTLELNQPQKETQLLQEDQTAEVTTTIDLGDQKNGRFTIVKSVMLIHTDESI